MSRSNGQSLKLSDDRNRLADELIATVLKITFNGADGSGFFVSPTYAITCAHLLGSEAAVGTKVTASQGDTELLFTLVANSPSHPDYGALDLCLLRLDTPLSWNRWAYLLGETEPGDELWAWGHPAGAYREGDSISLRLQGTSRRGKTKYLSVLGGPVTGGFSGSPVLSWRTGAVCGLIARASSGSARLVPIEAIQTALPEVRQDESEDRPGFWLDLLSDEQLSAGDVTFVGPTLRRYLHAASSTAEYHPYQFAIPNAPALSTVYLRQKVGSTATAASEHATASQGAIDTLAGDGLLNSTHTRVMVLGDPGSGKSSLLGHLAQAAADLWLRGDADNAVGVPVLVSAEALSSGAAMSDAIAKGVNERLGAFLQSPVAGETFQRPPLPAVQWLLLIDGLDEVLDAERRRVIVDAAYHLTEVSPDFRVLIATRPLASLELAHAAGDAGFTLFTIEPFDPEQVPQLAAKWFQALAVPDSDRAMRNFLAQLRTSRLLPLARLPLISTMLCVVFAADPENPLPPNRASLYARFVDILTAKRYRGFNALESVMRTFQPYGETAMRAVDKLQGLCVSFLSDIAVDRQSGSKTGLHQAFMTRAEQLRPAVVAPAHWESTVTEVVRQSGLVLERGSDFEFLHQTIEEFLAASVLAEIRNLDLSDVRRVLRDTGRDRSFTAFFVALLLDRHPEHAEEISAILLDEQRIDTVTLIADLHQQGVPLDPRLVSRATAAAIKFMRRGFYTEQLSAAEAAGILDVGSALTAWENMVAGDARGQFGFGILREILSADPKNEVDGYAEIALRERVPEWIRDRCLDALRDAVKRLGTSEQEIILRDEDQPVFLRSLISRHGDIAARTSTVHILEKIVSSPRISSVSRLMFAGQLIRTFGYDSGLLVTLARDKNLQPAVRLVAASWLAERDAVAASESLTELAADEELGGLRVQAALALSLLDTQSALGLLIGFARDATISDADRLVAGRACSALAHQDYSALEALGSDVSVTSEVRFSAAMDLDVVARDLAMKTMRTLARSNSATLAVRISAISRLAADEDFETLPILEQFARDPLVAVDVRLKCALILAQHDEGLGSLVAESVIADRSLASADLEVFVFELAELCPSASVRALRAVVFRSDLASSFRSRAALELACISPRVAKKCLMELSEVTDLDSNHGVIHWGHRARAWGDRSKGEEFDQFGFGGGPKFSLRLLTARQLSFLDRRQGLRLLSVVSKDHTNPERASRALDYLRYVASRRGIVRGADADA